MPGAEGPKGPTGDPGQAVSNNLREVLISKIFCLFAVELGSSIFAEAKKISQLLACSAQNYCFLSIAKNIY